MTVSSGVFDLNIPKNRSGLITRTVPMKEIMTKIICKVVMESLPNIMESNRTKIPFIFLRIMNVERGKFGRIEYTKRRFTPAIAALIMRTWNICLSLGIRFSFVVWQE